MGPDEGENSNNKMGCFNDPAWKVCGWWGGGVGGVADTNYLYPARLGWINLYAGIIFYFYFLLYVTRISNLDI